MKNSSLSGKELTWGWVYFAFQLLVLPLVLTRGNSRLPQPLDSAGLNFLYFLLNFLAVILIFRRTFQNSFRTAAAQPVLLLRTALLGFGGCLLSAQLFRLLVPLIRPEFSNLNDESILSMAGSRFWLIAVGTVVLVPPAEECFYRELLFRKLHPENPVAAYLVSALFFSAVHVMGFLGVYALPDLLLSLFQYLPAGFILAWSYRKTDSLFTPIFIHALVNLLGICLMR